MIEIFLVVIGVVPLVVIMNMMWQRHILQGEYARKFAHVAANLYVVGWAPFLSWRQMQIVWVLGLAGMLILKRLGYLKSVYEVNRKSLGDLLAPLTLGALTFLQPPLAIFIAAVLYLGLADGMAAVIGTRYGKGNAYTILGATKSVAGTLAFFVVAVGITIGFYALGGISSSSNVLLLALVPFGATLCENISGYGLDNATVPVFVYLSLLAIS